MLRTTLTYHRDVADVGNGADDLVEGDTLSKGRETAWPQKVCTVTAPASDPTIYVNH